MSAGEFSVKAGLADSTFMHIFNVEMIFTLHLNQTPQPHIALF